jgi:5-methyltetrahydropteroyltriglutamate--homocysteine methyltransferase
MEDAHCLNDLSLLEKYQNTSIILGVITVASSKIESVEHVAQRLTRALNHIDKDRLLAGPDCGLVMLGQDLALSKLKNMCEAAHSF